MRRLVISLIGQVVCPSHNISPRLCIQRIATFAISYFGCGVIGTCWLQLQLHCCSHHCSTACTAIVIQRMTSTPITFCYAILQFVVRCCFVCWVTLGLPEGVVEVCAAFLVKPSRSRPLSGSVAADIPQYDVCGPNLQALVA